MVIGIIGLYGLAKLLVVLVDRADELDLSQIVAVIELELVFVHVDDFLVLLVLKDEVD